jgi:chromate reductase, NAD(P)H dehydrogenase (quinone)
MSVLPGAIVGSGANCHLRQSLVFLNTSVMQEPEIYIGNAANLFDDNDDIANEATREFLEKFLQVFS